MSYSHRIALPFLAVAVFTLSGWLDAQPAPADVVARLPGHTDTVEAVAISADGTFVATACYDRNVRLFELATGKELRTFGGEQGHKGQVLCVAFSAKGDQLATGGTDNNLRVWATGTDFPSKAFATTAAVAGPFAGLRYVGEFLPPQERVARRLSFASSTPVKSLQHPNLVACAAFDDTGERVATGCHDGNLRIWDVPKATATKTIPAHVVTPPQQIQNPIYAVAWTPDYKQVFTASFDKTIKLWDVASGNLVREFKAAPEPKPILPKKEEPKKDEPKKDEKTDAKKDDKKDAKKDEKKDPPKKDEPKDEKGPFGHRDAVYSIALTKDGKFLASASSDKTIKLWDVTTGKVVREFPNPDLKPVFPDEPAPSHPGWVQAVRFTPDGQFLVSAGPAPKVKSYLAVWNVSTGKRLHGAERDFGPIHALAVGADGTKLVLGCAAPKGKTEPDAVIMKLPGR
jgi:WD40 repeat protein